MKITVTTYENGSKKTEVVDLPDTPELLAGQAEMKKITDSGFWCDCGNPETGRIEPVGHSVDVYCKNCDGCLQVG